MKELNDFFATIAEAKRVAKEKDIGGKLVEEAATRVKKANPFARKQVATVIEEVVVPEPTPVEEKEEEVLTQELERLFVSEAAKDVSPVNPNGDVGKEIRTVQDKLKLMENWVSRIAATGPGSGEVNFRYLDDVNRATMGAANNNWVLEYDSASGKVQFTDKIGPIQQVHFDLTHVHDEERLDGTLCWDPFDRTLNLTHPGGVTQQIGQEQYFLVRNGTAQSITSGTFCMFSGALEHVGPSNESRLLAAPMVSDGTFPSLYAMGVATQDIAPGEDGFVTCFGKVRELDTTAWNLGDIIYGDPTIPGGMTNVKPTAPNNVIPVAAVVHVGETDGEIFVRPTVEQKMLYGRFSSVLDQAPLAIETPYSVVFGTTDISRGFHVDGETIPDYSKIYAEESGFFKFDVTLSLTSTNSSAKAFYVWMRKNGIDIPRSAKRQSITGNGTYQVLNYVYSTSLDSGDYIQIMYAASDTAISINAPDATAFCPAIPSATIVCVQIAL